MLGLLGGVLGKLLGGTALGGGLLGGAAGGASLGGALGEVLDARRAQKQAYAREDTNIIRLVDQAKAVGLNPLSVIGSQGAAYQSGVAPMPSTGGVVSQALRDAELAQARKTEAEARKAEAEANIAQFHANNVGRAMYAPTLNSFPAAGRSGVYDDGAAASDYGYRPATQRQTFAGVRLVPSGAFSDAQAFEDRYGEIMGALAGVPAFGLDLLNTASHGMRRGLRAIGPGLRSFGANVKAKPETSFWSYFTPGAM